MEILHAPLPFHLKPPDCGCRDQVSPHFNTRFCPSASLLTNRSSGQGPNTRMVKEKLFMDETAVLPEGSFNPTMTLLEGMHACPLCEAVFAAYEDRVGINRLYQALFATL